MGDLESLEDYRGCLTIQACGPGPDVAGLVSRGQLMVTDGELDL